MPLFGRFALGQVTRDLGKSDDLAFRIPDRIDHDASPEPAAVLSHAPAFRLVFSGFGCGAERYARNPRLPVLVGVKSRKMLTENLLAPVSLDALRARVPVDDRAARIEHVDCVIGDAFHENPEPPFDVLQFHCTRGKLLCALCDALFQCPVELLQFLFRLPSCRDFLHARLVEAGIVNRDRGLCRKSHEDALGSLGEHAGLGVTVKKASQYFSGS